MPTKAYLHYGRTQTQPLYERNLFLYPDKLSLSSQNIGGFCLVVGIQVALRRFWRDSIHDWNRSIPPDEDILITSNSSYLGLIQNSLSKSLTFDDIYSAEKMFLSGTLVRRYPAVIYLARVNKSNTRTRCEICSKLTVKTPEQRNWHHSGVFIVSFEHILHLALMLRY